MYRTGDLGRYLSNGQVEFVARVDGQVKIRGFRVEPGEVEALLVRHPQVRNAAVVLRDPTDADLGLAAYVVATNRVTTPELRRYLLERLPNYMVPSAFMTLDTLPVTPNGKLDRAALPLPTAAVDRELTTRGPRDAVEATLVSLWRQALGCSASASTTTSSSSAVIHCLRPRCSHGSPTPCTSTSRSDGSSSTRRSRSWQRLSRRQGPTRICAPRPAIEPILRQRHRAWRNAAGELDVPTELRQIIREMVQSNGGLARMAGTHTSLPPVADDIEI